MSKPPKYKPLKDFRHISNYTGQIISTQLKHAKGIMVYGIQYWNRMWKPRAQSGYCLNAFSLVEMLMALLVASLLMAALAPVMTKRFKENINITGTGGTVIPKTFCAYVNNGTQERTEVCKVPPNTYSASAIIASAGGGGSGAVNSIASGFKTMIAKNGVSGAEDDRTYSEDIINFDKYTKDVVIKMASGGGGAGGGNYKFSLGRPRKQSDCEPFGVYVSAAQNGGNAICVSKYNPGESHSEVNSSPAIPTGTISGVKMGDGSTVSVHIDKYNAGDTASASNTNCTANGSCCWVGNTAASCTNGSGSDNYGGCNRTVCQLKAGAAICKMWKPTSGLEGRLPTGAELNSWAGHIVNSGANGVLNKRVINANGNVTFPGLQICNGRNESSQIATNTTECTYLDSNTTLNKCRGAQRNQCHIWTTASSTHMSNGIYQNAHFWGKNFSLGGDGVERAISVRCAIDEGRLFDNFTGASGGSGNYMEIAVPENIIRLATANDKGKIRTLAGAGGKGSAKESGSKGVDGSSSVVEIYDDTNLLWSIVLPGAKGGEGGSKTASGKGFETTEMCKYYDITDSRYQNKNGTEVSCSTIPGVGIFNRGNKGVDGSSMAAAGGISVWPAVNGTSNIGRGGNAGACNIADGSNNISCNDGTNGAGGRVEVKYKTVYPGIGGGGGSAGTLLHIKNFQVLAGEKINVTIGARGKGGAVGTKGEDGGNSFIEYNSGSSNIKYEVLGGKGGEAAIAGKPDNNPPIKPEAGKKGAASGITSSTKAKLRRGDEYFPQDNSATIGTDGIESIDNITSEGGNGGINSKISPLADANGRTPCGGMGTVSIMFDKDSEYAKCNNTSSNIPLTLTRTLTENVFNNDIINNYAPGSTGGGGGGWNANNTGASASAGADGLGGYVYIYFGDWSENNES